MALTVEGVLEENPGDGHSDQWEGVDCGLYCGGDAVETATDIELVQLKYSSANPDSVWTSGRDALVLAKHVNRHMPVPQRNKDYETQNNGPRAPVQSTAHR